MTSKKELENWNLATASYKKGDLMDALEYYQKAGPYAKIYFNIGMIYTRTGDIDSSEYMFEKAIESDEFMAVAYLQRGYAFFMNHEYELAEKHFKIVFKLLLNNDCIDYALLGLNYKLFRCELMFNLAMCYYQLKDDFRVRQCLDALVEHIKTDEQRDLIMPWVNNGKGRILLFTVPLSCIFELSEIKVKNLDRKKFMKNAKVAVATDAPVSQPGFIGFTGATLLRGSLIESHGTTLTRRQDLTKKKEYTNFQAKPYLGGSLLGSDSTLSRIRDGESTGSLARRNRGNQSNGSVARRNREDASNATLTRRNWDTASNASLARRNRDDASNATLTRRNGDDISVATITRRNRDDASEVTITSRNQDDVSNGTLTRKDRGNVIPLLARRKDSLTSRPRLIVPFKYERKNSSLDSGFEDSLVNIEIKVHYLAENQTIETALDVSLKDLHSLISLSFKLDSTQKSLGYYEDDVPEAMISILDEDDLKLALKKGKTKYNFYLESDDILDYYQ